MPQPVAITIRLLGYLRPYWKLSLLSLLGSIGLTNLAAAQTTLTPTETLSAARAAHRVETGQKFFGDAKYVGSDSCKSCHEKQHGEWAATWHAKMERLPGADSVIGDFNNRTITYMDIPVKDKSGKEEKLTFQIRTHQKDGKYFFTVLDKDNPANNQTFEIAKVLGGKWDQQYEIKVGENYLPTPIRWSVAAKDWLVTNYRPNDWVTPDGTPDGRPVKLDELPKNRFAEAKCPAVTRRASSSTKTRLPATGRRKATASSASPASAATARPRNTWPKRKQRKPRARSSRPKRRPSFIR